MPAPPRNNKYKTAANLTIRSNIKRVTYIQHQQPMEHEGMTLAKQVNMTVAKRVSCFSLSLLNGCRCDVGRRKTRAGEHPPIAQQKSNTTTSGSKPKTPVPLLLLILPLVLLLLLLPVLIVLLLQPLLRLLLQCPQSTY